jgi:hypothetical protein
MSKVTKPSLPANKNKPANKSQDVALICGKTDDGKGLHILRKRGSALEAGVVQPLEEGKSINGELVTLRQRGQTPLCDVEVHYSPEPAADVTPGASSATRGHPAQVATDDYRKNWDTIWRSKTQKNTLLN